MTMMPKRVLLPCLLCASTSVFAQSPAWQFAVGGDVRWFDWREYQNGERFLAEFGPLSLVGADMRVDIGQFYSTLGMSAGGGLVRYDGQLQNGTPYQADAWESVLETEWQLGWQASWGNLHHGLLRRDWDRKIEGRGNIAMAHERYAWLLFLSGVEWRLPFSAQRRSTLALDIGLPLYSGERVYSDTFGDFDLEPGRGHFWRIKLNWQNGGWVVTPFLQQQSMAASNAVQRVSQQDGLTYSIRQPESQRVELGVQLRYVFGARQPTVTPPLQEDAVTEPDWLKLPELFKQP